MRHRNGASEVIPNKDSGLVEVRRTLDTNRTRTGTVINITDIWRPIDIVPNFGAACPEDWGFENAVEQASSFFVNIYCDKETYQCTSF